MAVPKCPKCDHELFESNVIEPRGSRLKYTVINCAKCGAVLGVVDWHSVGEDLVQVGNAVKKIAEHLNVKIDY